MSASLRRNARLALLMLAVSACAKSTPNAGGLGDPCLSNTDCATGFLCSGGICVLPANLGGCEAGRLRCNGDDVEQCDPTGQTWGVVDTCSTGCVSGACAPQVCTPDAFRCEGNTLEECTPSGNAFAFVQECQAGCDPSGRCIAPVCTPFESVCSSDSSSVLTCDSTGAVQTETACTSGEICDSGRCQTVICIHGAVRCSDDGASTQTCDSLGDAWLAGSACPFGCESDANGASCVTTPACAANATQCVGSALEQCLPDQTGFGFVSFCATGCTASNATTAACNPLVCAPLQRQCESDGIHVDTCNQTGSAWQETDSCPQGCVAGQCVTNSAGCSVGELRCNGLDTQVCAAVPNDPGVTAWNLTGTCLTGCSSGACWPGGSCAGLHLEVGAATAPADGKSSVLVYSDPIVGADGGPSIPDGQLFTISAALAGGASDSGPLQLPVSTPDVDPATPGTQVASSGGRIRFTVPAAALDGGSATVSVAAQLEQGGSCAAQSSFALSTDPSVLGSTFLYAEDFSTTTFRDPQLTTADWSTSQEELVATWPDPIGNGGDGDLTVASGTSLNLSTSGYAPSFAVLGLGAQTATVDGPAQGISGGDEILLWDAQGSSAGTGNAGSYERLTVQSVDGSTIAFATPVQNSYGAAADQDVATQRVSIQRVPHFGTLTVAGTLTTSAWDGTKGGLIFLRASKIILGGAVAGASTIDVSGLGFRGGAGSSATAGEDATGVAGQDGPGGGAGGAGPTGSGGSYGSTGVGSAVGSTYGSKLLGKLFLGAGGGGSYGGNPGAAGGGAVVLFAGAIDFTSNGATVGSIHAQGANAVNAGSGAGGTIWLGAPDITVGTGASSVLVASGAQASNAGGAGRIRVDAQTVDAPGFGGAACTRAAPACTYGVDGDLVAASLPIFTVAPPQVAIATASLLVALDASPSIHFSASASGPFGYLPVSPGAPANFLPASSTPPGPTFSWQAVLAPAPSSPSLVKGLQWQLQISK